MMEKNMAGGGEWLDLFIYHLSLKENIGTAIDNANNDLREIYPSIANGPDSPTLAGSLMRWGDRYATISLT